MPRDDLPPLYEQVRRRILSEIAEGHLTEGGFLPPEPQLAERYSVSRITLRRALGDLAAEGVLIRQQGRGTLVAPRKLQQSISLSGFADTVEGMGHRAGHIVLSRDDAPAPFPGLMGLAPERPVRFDRLLELDGKPMTLEALWFDAARFPRAVGPVERGGSFFAALRECHGVTPGGAERLIDVGFATRDEAAALHVASTQPLYRIEKTVLGAGGEALAFSRLTTPCHLVTLRLGS